MNDPVPYPSVGVPVRKIQDAVDIQAAFIEMHAATELLIEKLNNEASTYSAIVDSFDRNHSQYGEMIAALSEEQMKLEQLAGVIDKMSQATTLAAQKMLAQYQSNVQQTIDNAFKKVDDAAVHRSLQRTIENSLSRINTQSIDKAAAAMSTGAAKIDRLDMMAAKTLNEIAGSVADFNRVVIKKFSLKLSIGIGIAGLLFGLIIGVFAHSAFVNQNVIKWTVDSEHQYFNIVDQGYYIRFNNQEAKHIDQNDPYFYVKINNIRL